MQYRRLKIVLTMRRPYLAMVAVNVPMYICQEIRPRASFKLKFHLNDWMRTNRS